MAHLLRSLKQREDMNSREANSPFMLQLRCFSHLDSINDTIALLNNVDAPTLQELEAVHQATISILQRIEGYIDIQAHNLQTKYRMPEGVFLHV